MLNVIMLNVIMLNVIKLSVVMLSVVAPSFQSSCLLFHLYYNWSRGICLVMSIGSFTTLLDISNVASVGIRGVGHSLKVTIGKNNMVLTLGGIAIAGLRGSNAGTTIAIIDSIAVVICLCKIRVLVQLKIYLFSLFSFSVRTGWNEALNIGT